MGQNLPHFRNDSVIQHTQQGLKALDGVLTSPVSKIWKLLKNWLVGTRLTGRAELKFAG